MKEASDAIENRGRILNRRRLAAIELILIGDTVNTKIDGEEVMLDSELFKKLWADPKKRNMLRTPSSIIEGDESPGETQKTRATKLSNISSELKLWLELPREYIQGDLAPFLSLGNLNSDGQVEAIGIFFRKGEQKINPPENAHKQIKFNLGLDEFMEYIENISGVMQYKINVGGK